MDQFDQVEPVDPAELTVWMKMRNNAKKHLQPTQSSDPTSQTSPVANPNVMAGQQETGVDPSTMAQGASAQLPSAQPPQQPQAPQDPSQHGAVKGTAQQALMKLAEAQKIPDSIAVERSQVEDLKKQIADYMAKPKGIDFSPLAALTDSWTGSNFSKSYKAPQTDAERIETMSKLQNMIAQRQGDLTKQEIALLNAKTGANKALAGTDKEPLGAALIQSKKELNENSAHQRNLLAIKKNPILGGLVKQSQTLSGALDSVVKAKNATPTQFYEMQSAVRRQMGMMGTSGVDERERTMLKDTGLKAAEVEQYFFNSPVDIKQTQAEMIAHMADIVSLFQKNIRARANAELKKAGAGNIEMYERRKDLKRGLDEVMNASAEQFAPEAISANPDAPTPAKGGTAAPKISFEEFQKRKREGKL